MIRKSSMNMVLHKFVFVVNIVFKSQKQNGHKAKTQVMVGFKNICGLPLIYGAIDYTQIQIQKPEGACATNFFPTNQKVTICNCKLLSTMKNISKMCLLVCWDP